MAQLDTIAVMKDGALQSIGPAAAMLARWRARNVHALPRRASNPKARRHEPPLQGEFRSAQHAGCPMTRTVREGTLAELLLSSRRRPLATAHLAASVARAAAGRSR